MRTQTKCNHHRRRQPQSQANAVEHLVQIHELHSRHAPPFPPLTSLTQYMADVSPHPPLLSSVNFKESCDPFLPAPPHPLTCIVRTSVIPFPSCPSSTPLTRMVRRRCHSPPPLPLSPVRRCHWVAPLGAQVPRPDGPPQYLVGVEDEHPLHLAGL